MGPLVSSTADYMGGRALNPLLPSSFDSALAPFVMPTPTDGGSRSPSPHHSPQSRHLMNNPNSSGGLILPPSPTTSSGILSHGLRSNFRRSSSATTLDDKGIQSRNRSSSSPLAPGPGVYTSVSDRHSAARAAFEGAWDPST